MDLIFSWVLTRDRPKGKETVKYERSVDRSDLPKSSEVEGIYGEINVQTVMRIHVCIMRPLREAI
ncbi:hypothetical protein ACJIZ3_008776 [Penstemon smallii]|uniref:Uncharacterized protein n=1 Tax=Penstemon smallii TaxID=265156 RepID=A0ABD3TC06_9LAMI